MRGGTPSTPRGALSGGNQQKVVLAREIDSDPKVLIAAQPTRGLDVGAIEFVHRRLVEQRDAGRAVLLVSLELEEILSLSDRILVIYEGRIVGEFPPTATEEELGFAMTGGRRRGGAHEPTTTELRRRGSERRASRRSPAPPSGAAPTPQQHCRFAVRRARARRAVITTLIAFLMGGLVVALTGKNPFKVYHAVFNGTGLNWFFHVGNYSARIPFSTRTCGSRWTPRRSPRRTCSRRSS